MPDFEVLVTEVRKVTLRCWVSGAEDAEHAAELAADGIVDHEVEAPEFDYDVLERTAVVNSAKETGC